MPSQPSTVKTQEVCNFWTSMKPIYFHTPCSGGRCGKVSDNSCLCATESVGSPPKPKFDPLWCTSSEKRIFSSSPWQTLCGAQILRTLVAFLWLHIVAVEVWGARQDSWLKGGWKMSWKAKMGAKPKSRRSNRWNNIYLVKPSTLREKS